MCLAAFLCLNITHIYGEQSLTAGMVDYFAVLTLHPSIMKYVCKRARVWFHKDRYRKQMVESPF